eukprot:Em0003g218a
MPSTIFYSLSRSAATVYDSIFLTTGYKVTVSALTNGPIPVDSTLTVTLFCTIDPTPPMPLSYVWYSSAPGNYINNQGPSATVYIFPRERKLSLYFCHVQSNESDVAVGYISIEPQGFLIPIGPTVVTYHYGDNIALEVSLSSNPRAQYIQSLQWYKDGNPLPVNCSSDMGVCTNTTGTRLTIQRAGNPDSPVIVITCAALNGTPDVHNITLMKNGSVLETVVGGNTLSYTVTWSGLGQYVCEVDSLYSTHQESIVLMESGSHDAEQVDISCSFAVAVVCPGQMSCGVCRQLHKNAVIQCCSVKQALNFCHVQSNGREVAVGYITIKPQGFLIPIGPTEVTYQNEDNIVLGVNIPSYYYLATYLQSLQRYKDGNPLPVNCYSDMRVYTNTMGTRLTIQRAGKSDESQYTVKIKNIQGVNNSFDCIQNLLSLLEGHYAAHSPITFTVSSSLVTVPPQVSLQAVPPHPSPDPPVIVITCAALNGTPDVHNITLMKNGSVLETVVGGNTLTYTVTWSGLGQQKSYLDVKVFNPFAKSYVKESLTQCLLRTEQESCMKPEFMK